MDKLTIDGVEYDAANLNADAKAQLNNLQFVNEKILQLNNELQISQTARIGYMRALNRELEKIGQ
jgi:hypothetical protein